jgi:hypothetical protein
VVFVFAILFLLFIIVMFGPQNFTITMWLAVALLPMVMATAFLRIPLHAKRMQKTSKVHFESSIRMTFLLDEVTVETSGPSAKSSRNYKYDAFYKVVETTELIYLYINSHQAHLVPKHDIASGKEIALVNLLKERVGKKFSTYY